MKCTCGSDKPLIEGKCPDCGKDYLYKDEPIDGTEEFEYRPLSLLGKPRPTYQELLKLTKSLEDMLIKKEYDKNKAESDLKIAVEALTQYRSIPIKTPVSILVSRVDYVAEEALQNIEVSR